MAGSEIADSNAAGPELRDGDPLQRALDLQPPDQYAFLGGDSVELELVINGMSRAAQFDEVLEAMDALQITAEERHAIFQLISAVLLLGNVQFEPATSAQGSHAAASHDEDACVPSAASRSIFGVVTLVVAVLP